MGRSDVYNKKHKAEVLVRKDGMKRDRRHAATSYITPPYIDGDEEPTPVQFSPAVASYGTPSYTPAVSDDEPIPVESGTLSPPPEDPIPIERTALMGRAAGISALRKRASSHDIARPLTQKARQEQRSRCTSTVQTSATPAPQCRPLGSSCPSPSTAVSDVSYGIAPQPVEIANSFWRCRRGQVHCPPRLCARRRTSTLAPHLPSPVIAHHV